MRNFALPGRSPVYAANAMVATSHPLASSSAIKVLQNGGNAVDAAVAASAVLGVVEPQMTGIGGDCFCILAEPDGSLHALNGSGRAAAGARLNWYLENGIHDLSQHPAHTVTVPAAVKAWETLLEKFGTFEFGTVLEDAIRYSEDGFPVAPRVAYDWHGAAVKLSEHAGAQKHLLLRNRPPVTGEIFRMPALGSALRKIADGGSRVMYQGALAGEIATTVQQAGGFLTEEDLASVSADWVDPVSSVYRKHELFEIPPNGQGITALILINLLRELGSAKLAADSPERVHLEMECARLAYAVRDNSVADPDTMQISLDFLLSDSFTHNLAGQFDSQARNPHISLPQLPSSDTVYLSVVDHDQRAVSFINSVYHDFGSGLVTPESGIVLQNRGACFVVKEGHPNAIGPGKRPMHTIIPPMVKKDGRVEYSFGVMGGAYQPMGHAHVLTNLLDYGMDPQEALDHHRVFWGQDQETLALESGAPSGLAGYLEKLGHKTGNAASPHGGGQIIWIDHEKGVLVGGSDPRKDGQAQGY